MTAPLAASATSFYGICSKYDQLHPQPDIPCWHQALASVHKSLALVHTSAGPALALEPHLEFPGAADKEGIPVKGFTPALPLERLGSSAFCQRYNVSYPLVGGSMARGISSVAMVKALAAAGMLGFYGAAGQAAATVAEAVSELKQLPDSQSWGINLIHSPQEPQLEQQLVELFLQQQVRTVEASAFLKLTPALVQYRVSGLYRDASGGVQAPNRIIAKASREEIARHFLSPPPAKILQQLTAANRISSEEAQLAAEIPMADDVTAEADSGGHTDNRPALAILPHFLNLRDQLRHQHGYDHLPQIGLGGGIATPQATAAAFAMGAGYVVTGSINQACVEAGTSDQVKQMLSQARQADIAMAPAADMFEMGGRVQVLKRGTMFAMRAQQLYDIYQQCQSVEALTAQQRQQLENKIFQKSLEEVWQETCRFFEQRDPQQLQRAQQEPRHKLALIMRWYLGLAVNWAQQATEGRQVDYQIWCGPAMGAFNAWTQNSFLAQPEQRHVATVNLNLLHGAAMLQRLQSMRYSGAEVPPDLMHISPRNLDEIKEFVA